VSSEFFFAMNVVLVSRLVFLLRDGPLSVGAHAIRIGVLALGLLAFNPGLWWVILFGALLAVSLASHLLETRCRRTEGIRLVELASEFLIVSVFFSPWFGISYNGPLLAWVARAGNFTLVVPLIERLSRHGSEAVLMGALLVLNESNLFLRLSLAGLRVGPVAGTGTAANMTPADRREYNTGRVIGLLERSAIYAAVMTDQVAAIGLVLAVKGLARFKEMDHRPFAEYVLVGTLLSALCAVTVALLVKSLASLNMQH